MARGRKKKGKTGQQSKGGGDDNLGLDVPNHNETNCGDGNDDVLDENKNNEGGNDICDDANNVGKSCDGDNGDGDNSDGIVNNNGGNDSNDVGYPPDSHHKTDKSFWQIKPILQYCFNVTVVFLLYLTHQTYQLYLIPFV